MTVVLATAIIALTSCGGDDDSSSAATSPAVAAAGSTPDKAISDDGSSSAATDAPAASAPQVTGSQTGSGDDLIVPQPDRLLIVEVTVGVEVADVGATVSDVIKISDHYGGQVYGSDVQLTDPSSSTGTVVIKLPPQNVEAMIAEVSALGRQVSRFQNTDDVTDRVTDINTRIVTAQQSVDRVQQLLASAKDLGEVVLLESELTSRQTVLEELLAEQRNLGNSTALATLTIDLTTTPVDTTAATDAPDAGHDGIGDAFAGGGRAFVTVVAAVLIFFGYTAPFLAVALVVGGIAWMITRRRAPRSRSAAPPPPPAPGADQRTSERDSADAARS